MPPYSQTLSGGCLQNAWLSSGQTQTVQREAASAWAFLLKDERHELAVLLEAIATYEAGNQEQAALLARDRWWTQRHR